MSTRPKPQAHAPVVSKTPEASDFDTHAGDDGALKRPATPRVIDFAAAAREPDHKRPGRIIDNRENDPDGHVMTAKRVRARARRRARRGERLISSVQDEIWKPVEEWDMEELARGRPRDAGGKFRGATPKYITREVHEKAMERFKQLVRANMNAQTVDAVHMLGVILNNDEVDNKGKPIVPFSTRADVAKFLLEHVVGKPVQPSTSDISVKLQAILGVAMVNPDEGEPTPQLEGYKPAHIGTRVEQTEPDDDDDIEDAEVVW